MTRAALAFAVLTMAMTWPIARHPATQASQHQDVYFNMWRLRWFAHALASDPAHLFDANIFFPEPDTLALSDAMPVEGVVAAPLVWAGARPVLVHNLLILLPIAASALAMFALARFLTGSSGGGAIAAVIFAYAPYRFDHLMHMELQWTVFMPLAFLALHCALDSGRWAHGLAFGACLALQMLCCIYYGIFLATLIVPAALVLAAVDRGAAWKAALPPLAAGFALALAIGAAYAVPYARQHDRVGDRSAADVDSFSARPVDYLSVPAGNWLYGNRDRPGRAERRLFPGGLAVLLSLAGLLRGTPRRRTIVYVLVLVAAFDLSLGFSGLTYPLLHRFVPAFRGLRAMGRAGIFVVMALAVLAAYGYASLVAARGVRARRLICAALSAGILMESATALTLVEFPNRAAPIYAFLARAPRGVVAELPFPRMDMLPGDDPARAYMSSFSWFPTVNGYSGNYPASYLKRSERLQGFPDDRSLAQLRFDRVRYVVVHARQYPAEAMDGINAKLIGDGMAALGRFDADDGPAWLFAMPRR